MILIPEDAYPILFVCLCEVEFKSWDWAIRLGSLELQNHPYSGDWLQNTGFVGAVICVN